MGLFLIESEYERIIGAMMSDVGLFDRIGSIRFRGGSEAGGESGCWWLII